MSAIMEDQRTTGLFFDHVRECPIKEILSHCDTDAWVFTGKTPPDATAICLYQTQQLLAVICVMPAQASDFQQLTQLPAVALANTLFIDAVWVNPKAKMNRIIPLALYFALRFGRRHGLENITAFIPEPNLEVPLATFLNLYALTKVPSLDINGKKIVAVAQRIEYSIQKIYDQIHEEDQKLLPPYFIAEILEIYQKWLERFYQGSWARAIIEETISKEQYIYSLYNMHQFVKYTTRLAARCVAYAEDQALRNHYINHLKGEINHELMIEKDLQALDADVNFLLLQHTPMQEINEFIVLQESVIGYKQDPVLMLACPLVAEGMTAYMRKDFIQHLYNVIASWGIQPESASKFLSSHMNTDGGEDGHWQLVIKMLQQKIQSETRLQQFLCVMQTAMNGFYRGFNAPIEHLKLWELTPIGSK